MVISLSLVCPLLEINYTLTCELTIPRLMYLLLSVSQRSTEQMRKVPTIILSITYKGVKFIDAANKVGILTKELLNSLHRNGVGYSRYEVGSHLRHSKEPHFSIQRN